MHICGKTHTVHYFLNSFLCFDGFSDLRSIKAKQTRGKFIIFSKSPERKRALPDCMIRQAKPLLFGLISMTGG